MGTGHFEEKDYYICYEILDDGGLQLLKLDANDTIIYETLDTQEAYVEISSEYNVKNKLYVPKNTIKVEYNFWKRSYHNLIGFRRWIKVVKNN